MTPEQLREVLKRQPFTPFTISLSDGRRFRVPHPDWVWVPPEHARIFTVGAGDHFSIVDLILVTSIDFGNGSPQRRSPRRTRRR